MLRKEITPIIEEINSSPDVIGTRIEYRLFGLLLYRKTMYTPAKYGCKEWQFIHRI